MASLVLISVLLHSFLSLRAIHGAPVLAPNISSCHLPNNLPLGETPFDCCVPFATASFSARLFRPQTPSSPPRVRRPSHTVDTAYARKLARAYDLMKALPSDDPRSFSQQANIHCAYCNTVYNQNNSSQLFQVHNTWLFFPFHRWYLYFHERILANLLGDDDFTLSFWNYDHPDGASIPELFSYLNSTLLNHLRDPLHSFPATVAIDYSVDTDMRPREVQLRENDNTMYRTLVRDASTQQRFFGWAYRQGDAMMSGYGLGTVEDRPHNSVHLWVGNKSQVGWKNMGSLYAAARDPVFYSHHAQLDRLWELWKTIPNHSDLEDPDYLDSEFAFYNEDAELVRVKVGDALNTTMLGYVYEEVEIPWINAVPVKLSTGPGALMANDTLCVKGEPMLVTCSFIAERDPEVTRESPWLHDRLVLEVQFNPMKRAHVDIYLNLPSANASMDTGCTEFFTYIESYPSFRSVYAESFEETMRYDMSERLTELNLTEQSSIVVTMVPRFSNGPTAVEAVTLMSSFVEYTLPSERWDAKSNLNSM